MNERTSTAAVNVAANREAIKWSRRELVGRALWEIIGQVLFRFSPRPIWAYRNLLLRAFGATIGRNVRVHPTVKITIPWNLSIRDEAAVGDGVILYALGPIGIGNRVTISQGAHLCAGTHDYRDPAMPLLKLPICVGDDAWICADAFIGPGVTVGNRAVVGARAVAFGSIANDIIVVGNPAREIKKRFSEHSKAAAL